MGPAALAKAEAQQAEEAKAAGEAVAEGGAQQAEEAAPEEAKAAGEAGSQHRRRGRQVKGLQRAAHTHTRSRRRRLARSRPRRAGGDKGPCARRLQDRQDRRRHAHTARHDAQKGRQARQARL